MKQKGLIITTIAGMVACCGILEGCEWRPFGRDYFVSSTGGEKASDTYGEPWVNSVAYGTVKEDTPHDINDDIYLGVNYDKIIATALGEGEISAGVRADAEKNVRDRLLGFMQDTASKEASVKQVSDLYALFNDTEARKDSWENNILPLIKVLQTTESLEALSEYLSSESYFINGTSIVSFDYDIDYNDTGYYSFVIVPTSLSLGDAAEYSEKSDYGNKTEEIFKKQAKLLLEKAGYASDGADTIIQKALDFESDIAKYMKDQDFKATSDYVPSVNNPVTISDISTMEEGFPLDRMLQSYGIGAAKRLYLLEPEWLDGMSKLYTDDNFEGIKSYVLIKTLQGFADIADEETYNSIRDIYNEAYDIKEGEELSEYSYTFVKNNLSGTLGRLYCDRYVNVSDKSDVMNMAKDIIATYKDEINSADYFSENVKELLIKKLDNMKLRVAFSDSSPSASSARLKSKDDGGTLTDAVVQIRKSAMDTVVSYLDKEVSEELFDQDVTEASVNYWNIGNILDVNAGVFNNDYYSSSVSKEEKYGGLGMLIAEAIGNAVFGQGALYDETGKYAPYMTEADSKAYETHFDKIKNELNEIKPFKDDTKLDGARVLNSVACEITAFDVVKNAGLKDGAFDIDVFTKAYAASRFTLMREDLMEQQGLNSSQALPYILVNMAVRDE